MTHTWVWDGGPNADGGVPCPAVQVNATQNVEARICERLHIGGHISYRRLLEDLAGMGFSSNQVGRVLGGPYQPSRQFPRPS